MQHANLGKAGLQVSRICLGCMSYGSSAWRPWVLDEDASRPFFAKALDLGINFFDTADIYSDGASEEVTGRVLLSMVPRHEVVIATKVFNAMGKTPNDRGLSRKHIMQAIDASLRRLGTDHVDLYQIHRFDPMTPVEETMEALHDVVKAGKALYIGASSMRATQFARMQHTADRHGWTRFVTMQNHYNLVYREEENDMNPFCVEEGVGLIPWSPLARGFLAGNRKPSGGGETVRAGNDAFADRLYFQPSDFVVADRTGEVAREHGVKSVQVALAWLLQRPGVVAPIVGATKSHHLDDAVAALDLALTVDDIRRLEEPYVPHPAHAGT